MKISHRRCAGLDVHKRTIRASIRLRPAGRKDVEVITLEFGTFLEDIRRLRDWLREHKVRHVAMESTGVYWIPVWNVLEKGNEGWFHLALVNPQQVKALPGKKTDQQDSERIAELHQYGLLRGSFIPPPEIRQLRDLTRRRTRLQHDRNRVINRIGGLLETVNCKLGSVVSDLTGQTSTAILAAIAAGAGDPEKLADMAMGSLKSKIPELRRALKARYTDHFRWQLRMLLRDLGWIDDTLSLVERRINEQAVQFTDVIRRLCTIPTVKLTTALALIAEIGTDMSVFGDSAHLASWAGLCPGNKESAGKRLSGATRKGNRYLRRLLIQNAWAVSRMKDCYLTGVFYRIAQRKGTKKAAMAIAHKILVIAFHVIRDEEVYHEIGGDFHDRLNPGKTVRKLARRIERLGYSVSVALSDMPGLAPPADGKGKTPRKRGRPCLCKKRGLICIHGT